MPFIVKDEMRIDSAVAFNQSSDHLLSSLSLLGVGFYSQTRPDSEFQGAGLFMVLLSALSVYFYFSLYRFDRDKKGSLLDTKPLGEQKSYIDLSRTKLHKVFLSSDNQAVMILSPLLDSAGNVKRPGVVLEPRQEFRLGLIPTSRMQSESGN